MREKELCMLRGMLETSDMKSKEQTKSVPKSFINFFCECLLKVVNGSVPVKKTMIQGYENSFKKILSKQTSLEKKGRFLLKTRLFWKVLLIRVTFI